MRDEGEYIALKLLPARVVDHAALLLSSKLGNLSVSLDEACQRAVHNSRRIALLHAVAHALGVAKKHL